MKVSVSVLSSKINAIDIIKELDNSNADFIHLDIMDGIFVQNKTWDINEVNEMIKYSKLPIDAHFMVSDPIKYLNIFSNVNLSYFTFHYEVKVDIIDTINKIRKKGFNVGISICPDTDVEVLYPYLKYIDQILIMSVYPGKSGQVFINESVNKIKKLRNEIDKQGVNTIISVDGGINNETGKLCKDAGVNMLVSASYIHNDILRNINLLKNI